MKKVRLLITINVRWWNAEAAYAVSLARAFFNQGASVWMVVNDQSLVHRKAREARIPVINEIQLDSISPWRIWRNYCLLKALIQEKDINIINSFKSNGTFLLTWLRNSRDDLLYFRTRGEASPPKNNFFNRYLYGVNGCDGVITAGNTVYNWVDKLDIKGQKIRTIYYADSPQKKEKNIDLIKKKKELGITKTDKVIALIGRTQSVKGHRVLLEAFNQLNTEFYHLLFLVKDLDEYPKELEFLKQYIQKHSLERKVTILGFRKDLPELLQLIDLCVIPSSHSEVNCRVVVESFSMGVPIVAFPTGSLPEVINHQKNGYICHEKTSQSLSRAIQWMFQDEKKFSQMKKNALQTYRQRFTLEQLYQETISFYHS